MGKRWWETKEYQLRTGRWVPQVHLYEDIGAATEVSRLLARRGVSFATQEEAQAYSNAMALKWLNEN